MSNRQFISNITFLVFVNLIVKPFWIFGIDRTVQNAVGAEQYGTYFALFNFTMLFHILLDFDPRRDPEPRPEVVTIFCVLCGLCQSSIFRNLPVSRRRAVHRLTGP